MSPKGLESFCLGAGTGAIGAACVKEQLDLGVPVNCEPETLPLFEAP